MHLKQLLAQSAAVVLALGVSAAVVLVFLSTTLRQTVDFLGESVESVRDAEELELVLHTLDREQRLWLVTQQPSHRQGVLDARGKLDGLVAVVQNHVTSDDERKLVDEARRAIAEYLRQPMSSGASDEALAQALAAVERVTTVNVVQARESRDQVQKMELWGRVLGFGLAGLLLLSILATLGVFRWRVYRPLLSIREMVARFRGGDKSARVDIVAPTELEDIAHELNDMASALDRQETAQVQFLAGVAHDLRNPLQALKLSVYAGTVGRLSEERMRQVLARVDGLVNRLDRMVSDLMDRTRIQAGNLELDKKPVDVCRLVTEVVELFKPTSDRHALRVDAPEAGVFVEGDDTRLEQVMTNLLSNALKYSPDGGEVKVAVLLHPKTVELSVTDEGLGMAQEDLLRVFEPFRRSEATRHQFPGAGLGLSVSRKIVEAHGGTIEVTSRPEEGSTFRVILPRSPARVDPRTSGSNGGDGHWAPEPDRSG